MCLKQNFGWPDQPSSDLDVTKFKRNEITMLYSGEFRNQKEWRLAEMTNKTMGS